MKKIIFSLLLSIFLAVALVFTAFFYIDLSGHQESLYEISDVIRGEGTVKVDRYTTENQIVYKESAVFPHTLEYPETGKKLYLKKDTKLPLKFIEEASTGVKGPRRVTILTQDANKTDFLFLEQPRFFVAKAFETGEKTLVFSPDDVISYMQAIELYNFWKKGSQFFEVMIPTGEALPPMRDKLEVKYLYDEYIPAFGRRVEAEAFVVRSAGLPEAKMYLLKYRHRVLSIEIEKTGFKAVLVATDDHPSKKTEPAVITTEEPKLKSAEISFNSADNLTLSGRLWLAPAVSSPAVLIVPDFGPAKRGMSEFIEKQAEAISSLGLTVMAFDGPGHGKSQGDFSDIDDADKVQHIRSAIKFLSENPAAKGAPITVIGYEEGACLAIEAAKEIPEVASCVMIGIPKRVIGKSAAKYVQPDTIKAFLRELGLGPFSDTYISTVTTMLNAYLEEIRQSTGNDLTFLRVKLPLRDYRSYLARPPYDEVILSSDKPLLFIAGKNEQGFSQPVIDNLERSVKEKKAPTKVAVIRSLPAYMGFDGNSDAAKLIENWLKEMSANTATSAPLP